MPADYVPCMKCPRLYECIIQMDLYLCCCAAGVKKPPTLMFIHTKPVDLKRVKEYLTTQARLRADRHRKLYVI